MSGSGAAAAGAPPALTDKQQDALATFQSITGLDSTAQCIQILQAHDWVLDHAVATALAAGGDVGAGAGGGGGGARRDGGGANVPPPRPQSEPQRLVGNDPLPMGGAGGGNVVPPQMAAMLAQMLRAGMSAQLSQQNTNVTRLSAVQGAAARGAGAGGAAAAAPASAAAAAAPAASAAPAQMTVAQPVSALPKPGFMSAGAGAAASASSAAARAADAKDVKAAAAAAPAAAAAAAAPAAEQPKSWYQKLPGAGLVGGLVGGAWRFAASLVTGGASDSKQPAAAGAGGGGAAAVAAGGSESEQFARAFERTYPAHPRLVHGTYSDAIRSAKAQSRPLFVYLQSDAHDDTPKFCADVLCAESFRDFLNENFVVWFGTIKHSDAYRLSQQLNVQSFPFISVLIPQGTSLAVAYHRSGLATAEHVLAELVQVLDAIRSRTQQRLAQRATVARDRQIIAAQDREYREALEADRKQQSKAKEAEAAAAQRAAELKRKAEADAKAAAEAAEMQRQREAAAAERKRQRDAEREAKRAALPEEPAPGPDVASVRVALLNAQKVTRRFALSTTLGVLFTWIDTHEANAAAAPAAAAGADGAAAAAAVAMEDDAAPKAIQVVATHPRRVFTDPTLTLKALGLGRNIMLFVEEKADPSAAAAAAAGGGAAPMEADAAAPAAAAAAAPAAGAAAAAPMEQSPEPSPGISPQPSAGGMEPLALARGSSAGASPAGPVGAAGGRDRPGRPQSKLVAALTRQSSAPKSPLQQPQQPQQQP